MAATDIYFSRLLKHLVDRHGSPLFLLSELSPEAQEEVRRDAAQSLLCQWMHALKQERREICVPSLALLARLLLSQDRGTAKEIKANTSLATDVNTNIHADVHILSSPTARFGLPAMLTEVRSVPLALITRMMRIAACNKLLLSLSHRCLEVILMYVLADTSPIVRARGIKALSRWTGVDADLILQENVRNALINTLSDRAISVREEAVKLLGTYVSAPTGHDRLGSLLLHALKPLLRDEGVSVRKSVVALFREVLQNQPAHRDYQELALALLQRLVDVKEEESVKGERVSLICSSRY